MGVSANDNRCNKRDSVGHGLVDGSVGGGPEGRATAPEVFKALNEVVPQLFNLKSSDDCTLSRTFTSDLRDVESTRDPKHVVVPQRERLNARRPAWGDERPGRQFPRFVRSSQRSP